MTQVTYCHSIVAAGGIPIRTVDAGYRAAAHEFLSIGAPAAAADVETALAGYTAAQLAQRKSQLKDGVDGIAEILRLGLITPGSGQAMEYQEAYAEAVQVDAWVRANPGQTVDPSPYLMLARGRPATDIVAEARAVMAAYDAYRRAGAVIRAVRLDAKAAIDAAVDVASAQAAFDAIVWPALG